jgi:hypothetical protein
MEVLKKVVIEPKGGNNQFSLCLIINKMIMYYQLDLYKDFCLLKNNIETSGNIYLNNNLFFNLYKYFINIDMMMQRGLYSEANTELDILKKNISENKYLIESKQINENNPKNKKVVILPNDLNFKVKELNKLTNLYQIFINSYIKYKNSNECNALIKELKEIKIEEPENNDKDKDKDKEKEKESLSTSNNNLKSFQKYLLLRLNYLNNVAKNPNGKISYKINDKLLMLNIEGNSPENELNKIYYYHYQGIISLKNEKYNISSYFFLNV